MKNDVFVNELVVCILLFLLSLHHSTSIYKNQQLQRYYLFPLQNKHLNLNVLGFSIVWHLKQDQHRYHQHKTISIH